MYGLIYFIVSFENMSEGFMFEPVFNSDVPGLDSKEMEYMICHI